MRPKERRDSGHSDLFRARLDQIVDLSHPVAKLDAAIDWRFLEERFGAVFRTSPVSRRCPQGTASCCASPMLAWGSGR